MNQYFGWVQGSNMPATYVHLSGREIDDAILSMNGIKTVEKKESALKPKICQRCSTINVSNAERCSNCFARLEQGKVIIQEQEENLIQRKIQNIKLNDYEVSAAMQDQENSRV